MVLDELLLRPRDGAAMVPVASATAAAGLGLVGDVGRRAPQHRGERAAVRDLHAGDRH